MFIWAFISASIWSLISSAAAAPSICSSCSFSSSASASASALAGSCLLVIFYTISTFLITSSFFCLLLICYFCSLSMSTILLPLDYPFYSLFSSSSTSFCMTLF